MAPRRLVTLVVLGLVCTRGLASELAADPALMEGLAERIRSLDARIAARDPSGGEQEARALAAAFDAIAASYATREDGREGVAWSGQGKDLANEIARLLASNELDRAQRSVAAVGATCAGCHRAYR